jgi:serine/threonine protein kinase
VGPAAGEEGATGRLGADQATVLDADRGAWRALQPGTVLAGFRVEALLGRGATASVYRAFQQSLQRSVALKVLAPQLASEPGFVSRFRREGVQLARLQHEAALAAASAHGLPRPAHASGVEGSSPFESGLCRQPG